MQGRLWIIVLSGVMGAATVWTGGVVEWRHQTQEPRIVRRSVRPPHYAGKRSDHEIAQAVFHATRVPQTVEVKQAAKSPSKSAPVRQSRGKSGPRPS